MTNVLQQPPQVKKRDKLYDLSTFKVLIVEDFPFIANLLASSLKEIGIGTVSTADNGLTAKQDLLNFNAVSSSSNYDVIILDWLMPQMSGLELLRWLRSHKSDSIRFIPVIICSAYTSKELVEQGRDNGATEVMVKPLSAEVLAHRIASVIDSPRPYLKTATFFGPDRRRKTEQFTEPDRRTTKSEDISEHHEHVE